MKTVFEPGQLLNRMKETGNNHASTELLPDRQGQRELIDLLTPLYDRYHGFGMNPYARVELAATYLDNFKFRIVILSLVEFPSAEDSLLLFEDFRDTSEYSYHLLAFENSAHAALTSMQQPRIHFWKQANRWAVLSKNAKGAILSHPTVVTVGD